MPKGDISCIGCAFWERHTFDNNGTSEFGMCTLYYYRSIDTHGCLLGYPWYKKMKALNDIEESKV